VNSLASLYFALGFIPQIVTLNKERMAPLASSGRIFWLSMVLKIAWKAISSTTLTFSKPVSLKSFACSPFSIAPETQPA
ncbi:MAG: hypothetical protein QXF24_02895, partial [Thermoproteota archaeon]